jgi:hypothetical protein
LIKHFSQLRNNIEQVSKFRRHSVNHVRQQRREGQKMIRKIAAGAAAVALAISSVAAQAAPAPRTASPVGEKEQLAGSMLWIALAAIAVGVGIFLIVDDSDEEPASP